MCRCRGGLARAVAQRGALSLSVAPRRVPNSAPKPRPSLDAPPCRISVSELDLIREWWRIFTCGWLHSGLIHLALNLGGLLALGVPLERVFGFWRTSLLYVVSGVFGVQTGAPQPTLRDLPQARSRSRRLLVLRPCAQARSPPPSTCQASSRWAHLRLSSASSVRTGPIWASIPAPSASDCFRWLLIASDCF